MSKSYREFDKTTIGESDIATLIMFGPSPAADLSQPQRLNFGEDSLYAAYVVTDADVEIDKHYTLVGFFKSWIKIYDDFGLSFKATADVIKVYRAGSFGCIIQLIGGDTHYETN